MTEQIAQDLVREYGSAVADRANWDSHWESIAEVLLPGYVGMFTGGGNRTDGARNTENIFDSTAPIALTRFGSVMESMLTPRNQTWHGLAPMVYKLLSDRQTRLWMEEARNLLFRYRYAPKANFAGQTAQVYMSLGAFGTGALFVDELDTEPGLRYKSIPLNELVLRENHQGVVDIVYRRFQLDARQAIQKFGMAMLPDKILECAKGDSKKQNQKFWFIHCVKPNSDYNPDRLDAGGMKYKSVYVSEDGPAVVKQGGYVTFPYAISRYTQMPGEVYGRSPAMDVLPAILTLNDEKKTMLKVGHRAVDPVLLVHDDGIIDTFSLRAGAMNSGGVSADGRPLVHTLPTGRLDIGEKMMELERTAINDAFLITLFQVLVESPQMTATEVIERTREKGMLLSPTMGRQQSEFLGPLIEREMDLMSRQGLLPPMPPSMREMGSEYQVEYTSPLARAQKAEEAGGFMRWAEAAMNMAAQTQDPSAMDWIDVDTAMPELADFMAVPAKWVRDPAAVKSIRDSRQQQMETQQMVDAAPAAASVMKSVQGATKNGKGN